MRDVHLPGSWHLNARRIPIPPVPRRGQAWRDEIWRRWAILSTDLCEDLAFTMDSEWWDRPANEPYPRHRFGLLSDAQYDYAAKVYPLQ
jgi:hypothetical protein